jgi:putative inorganic carbon (hco3(-)) transporter
MAIGLTIAKKNVTGIFMISASCLLAISWLISRFELQRYFLILLSFLLPFSYEYPLNGGETINMPTEPMLAIGAFSIGWDIVKKNILIKELFNHQVIWILFFLISFVIGTFFSTILWVSVKFSIVNLTYILIFFVWQKHLFKIHSNLFPILLSFYSLAFLMVLAKSIYQLGLYDWNVVTIKGIFRPFYKDNTIFGATAALLTAFWILCISRNKKNIFNIICFSTGILLFTGTILSNCRAAFLSLIFCIIVRIALYIKLRLKHLAASFVLGILLLGTFHETIYNMLSENRAVSHAKKFDYMDQIASSGNISTDVSNIERLNRWISGLRMFLEKPFTGFGPGTYQFTYIPYQKHEWMNRLTVTDPWHLPENSGGTAHSEYVLALSEMGVLGIVGFLIILGRLVWIAFEKSRNHPQRRTIIIAFTVISTYIFHAFFNNFLNTDKFAFLFWGSIAWMMASFELQKKRTNKTPSKISKLNDQGTNVRNGEPKVVANYTPV